MQLIADRARILRRHGEEEAALVRQCIESARLRFLHEDVAAVLDELIEIIALLLELRERRLVLLDARQERHRAAVDVRPCRAARVLVDLLELVDDRLARGDGDDRTRALTVHRIALRHGEGEHDEHVVRQTRELVHEGARLVLLPRVVDVGDVDEDAHLLALRRVFLREREHAVPVLFREAEARRVVRRRVDDDEQAVLLLHDLVHLRRIGGDVELLLLVKQRVIRELAAALVADDVVRAPEPIGRENIRPALGVVRDRMVDGARAARRRHGAHVPFGLMVGKREVDDGVEISRQTRNWSVGDDVLHRQRAIDTLHRRQAGKFPLIVDHRADRRIRDLVRAVFRHRFTAGGTRTENRILESLVPCMGCSHTLRHLITPP